ncbi:unnamed protein product [Candida verbasci]|uniref:GATA-type domain-containing protein n=1 Tax=Candida verbasci TaxID=1227364 RepID=A0A9W4TWR5_9ASCO|nr:unnamed protein product [Candida verbasci]
MSLVQSTMFNHHLNRSGSSSHHHRSRSFELLKQVNNIQSNKRSYSDDLHSQSKRSKTAPPSPPYDNKLITPEQKLSLKNIIKPNINLRSRSLSPNKKFINPLSPSNSPKSSPITSPETMKIKLPSISAALNQVQPLTEEPIKLKPITPSTEYFEENSSSWRYELLDKITKQSKHFHLNQYNYLNNHAQQPTSVLLPKIKTAVDLPYESSNYTYNINKLKEIPEYLELAQSLISLSEPKPVYYPPAPITHKFIPITTPPKKKSEISPKTSHHHHHHHHATRICLSCSSDQSPCWRPSWSIKEGQLCNSCGLRYKKTSARCLNDKCRKIPAKGEWSLMQSKEKVKFEDGHEGYSCLECGWRVEVKK